jgi:hypothetical protein
MEFHTMTENNSNTVIPGEHSHEYLAKFSGSGERESDPLTFNAMRTTAPDQAAAAVASLADVARHHEAAFRSSADLSANLPADVRKMVSDASSAITSTVATAQNARTKAETFRADISLYPAGREALAGEAISAARDKIGESFAHADALVQVAEAELFLAARPKLAQADAMTARADLDMITRRAISTNSPGVLADTLRGLASGGDSLAALVADETYMRRFLAANGIDSELAQAIVTGVRHAVVKGAAESGDAKRAAAGKTSLALTELRKARAAATSYTRHKLSGK